MSARNFKDHIIGEVSKIVESEKQRQAKIDVLEWQIQCFAQANEIEICNACDYLSIDMWSCEKCGQFYCGHDGWVDADEDMKEKLNIITKNSCCGITCCEYCSDAFCCNCNAEHNLIACCVVCGKDACEDCEDWEILSCTQPECQIQNINVCEHCAMHIKEADECFENCHGKIKGSSAP